MAQEDHSTEKLNKSASPFCIPTNFLEMNKELLAPLKEAQSEFIGELQAMNQKWASRLSSEADLTSELVSKLASARSLPNVASAYQDWLQQHIQLFAEDSRQFMSSSQKFMQAGARAFSNVRRSNGT